MRKTLTIAAIWLVFASQEALAQDAASVHVGSRVRVRAGKRSFVGKVDAMDRGALTLIEDWTPHPIAIPTASITRVEISSARRRHAGKGALIGAGTGALLGLLASSGDTGCGLVLYEPCTTGRLARNVVVIAASAGLWGSLIGALVVSEDWREASVEDVRSPKQVRVSIAPVRRGARLALSVSF